MTLLELTAKSRSVYQVASLAMKFVRSIHQVFETRWSKGIEQASVLRLQVHIAGCVFSHTGLNLHKLPNFTFSFY